MSNTNWYAQHAPKPKLDYSKPIAAFCDLSGEPMLLIPCPVCRGPSDGEYDIAGYNWFRISDGSWNSSVTWKSPEDAVRCYERTYEVRNVESITIK